MKAFLLSSSLALLLPALWVQVDVLSILTLVGAQRAPRAFPRAKRAREDGPTVCGDSTGSGDVPALVRGGLCFGVLMVTFRAGGPCVCCLAAQAFGSWPLRASRRGHKCGTGAVGRGGWWWVPPGCCQEELVLCKAPGPCFRPGEDPLNNQIVKYCFDLFLFIIF